MAETPPRKGGGGMSPVTPTGRTQALKDLKLTIEYKHLKQNAPGGVLVTPAFDDLRKWHGVIFVRKGYYQGAVFKFTVTLPREYNDHGVHPQIRFTQDVFNPYVVPVTSIHGGGEEAMADTDDRAGLLDLESAYPEWDPTAHFMVTALTFVKKIFYLKDEDLIEGKYPADQAANPEALQTFLEDKDEFKRQAARLANLSDDAVYANPMASPIKFSTLVPVHERLRQLILETNEHTVRSSGMVLELVNRAKREPDFGGGGDDEEDEDDFEDADYARDDQYGYAYGGEGSRGGGGGTRRLDFEKGLEGLAAAED